APIDVPADAKLLVLYAREAGGAILDRRAALLGPIGEIVSFAVVLPNVETEFGVAYADINLRESSVEWLGWGYPVDVVENNRNAPALSA
ncbi:MAG TPA: hypothetical protein VK669_10425, partial [Candidatus Limnocylindrales bacterium]|nr:hypothetical protein [Candidatus Limnocylindrales bacterium]